MSAVCAKQMALQQLQPNVGVVIIGIKSAHTTPSFVQMILVKVRIIKAIMLMSVEREATDACNGMSLFKVPERGVTGNAIEPLHDNNKKRIQFFLKLPETPGKSSRPLRRGLTVSLLYHKSGAKVISAPSKELPTINTRGEQLLLAIWLWEAGEEESPPCPHYTVHGPLAQKTRLLLSSSDGGRRHYPGCIINAQAVRRAPDFVIFIRLGNLN